MERHYTLVNDCIGVLQEKNIGPIHTLCFKVQLSKLQQLLLERDLDETTGNHPMVSLRALRRDMAAFEGDEIRPAAFEKVNRELQHLTEVVAGWAAPGK